MGFSKEWVGLSNDASSKNVKIFILMITMSKMPQLSKLLFHFDKVILPMAFYKITLLGKGQNYENQNVKKPKRTPKTP